MSLESRARQFAERCHGAIDQRRKYTNEPYIVHPEAVVTLVKSVPHTEEMVAAAWLHDTVEDTSATLADIEREFGHQVATLVEMLTDISKPEDGNRQVRKELDRCHTAKASPAAKTVKLADLLDNTASITRYDPGFARKYMKEKQRLLDVLKEGDATLWAQADAVVKHYFKSVRPRRPQR